MSPDFFVTYLPDRSINGDIEDTPFLILTTYLRLDRRFAVATSSL
jgi:hypothetical protein